MTGNGLTDHAAARQRQRGIPGEVVDCLLDFGHEEHDHRRGAVVVYFDHRARDRVRRIVGREAYRRLESHLNAYVVLGRDGAVVTVGHRTRRINRN